MSSSSSRDDLILTLLHGITAELGQLKAKIHNVETELFGRTAAAEEDPVGLMETRTLRQVIEKVEYDLDTVKAERTEQEAEGQRRELLVLRREEETARSLEATRRRTEEEARRRVEAESRRVIEERNQIKGDEEDRNMLRMEDALRIELEEQRQQQQKRAIMEIEAVEQQDKGAITLPEGTKCSHEPLPYHPVTALLETGASAGMSVAVEDTSHTDAVGGAGGSALDNNKKKKAEPSSNYSYSSPLPCSSQEMQAPSISPTDRNTDNYGTPATSPDPPLASFQDVTGGLTVADSSSSSSSRRHKFREDDVPLRGTYSLGQVFVERRLKKRSNVKLQLY